MTDCNKYQEQISAMLDGELSPAGEAELRSHLEHCEECRLVHDAFSAISGYMPELVEPPERFVSGTMFKIRLQSGGGRRRFSWGAVTAVAACLALVLLALPRLTAGLITSGGSVAPMAVPAAGDMADAGAGAYDTTTAAEAAPEAMMDAHSEEQTSVEGARSSSENGALYGLDTYFTAESVATQALGEVSGIELYSAHSEEPVLASTDEETITALSGILAVSGDISETEPSGEPLFVLDVSSAEPYSISIWLVEGRLVCEREGALYTAEGSLDDILDLISGN